MIHFICTFSELFCYYAYSVIISPQILIRPSRRCGQIKLYLSRIEERGSSLCKKFAFFDPKIPHTLPPSWQLVVCTLHYTQTNDSCFAVYLCLAYFFWFLLYVCFLYMFGLDTCFFASWPGLSFLFVHNSFICVNSTYLYIGLISIQGLLFVLTISAFLLFHIVKVELSVN